MPYSPSAPGAAIANQIATNLAAAGASAMQTAIAGGAIGPGALADGIIAGVGYQAFSEVAGNGSAAYTGATFADADFNSFSWTAPLTKTYVVHVDVSLFITVGVGAIEIKLNVGGTDYPTSLYTYVNCPSVSNIYALSFRIPVAFTAGSPTTIKLRWASNGTNGANAGANARRAFTITG